LWGEITVYMLERAIKEFQGFGANLFVNLDQFYFNLVAVSKLNVYGKQSFAESLAFLNCPS